ncbi:MAG TPA: histone-like nucleoid-structuring protein Lsr2, partial [Micromonosporaceae bacterium]|nr:histone-like nucleoid-structuring protein Lsr2 [Micromonosporaceae bacterium]
RLRDSLAGYVAAGRKVGRGGLVPGGRTASARGSASDREQNKAIREWARKAKKDVADRGRIPQDIIDEYHAKTGRR